MSLIIVTEYIAKFCMTGSLFADQVAVLTMSLDV